jgi:SAM-dependent methyltransferase
MKGIPGSVRLVRWLRHCLRRLLLGNWQKQYWAARKDMLYYREVLRLARLHAPQARSVIDVGSMNTQFILQLQSIPFKVSLDLHKHGRLRGVTNIRADFTTWYPDRSYDLVLCLQVLEHLDDPAGFIQRLLACGKKVIISVPYKWPLGHDLDHVQDPIDEAKLAHWIGRPWIDQSIAKEPNDGLERIVVVLDGAPSRPRA